MREDWEASELHGASHVRADLDVLLDGLSLLDGGLSAQVTLLVHHLHFCETLRRLTKTAGALPSIFLHLAGLTARAFGALAGLTSTGLGEAAAFHRRVSSHVRSNVLALCLVADNQLAFFSDKVDIRPVAAVEFAEDEDALVADLEGAGTRDLLEVRNGTIIVLNEVVVDVVVEVLLGDHILHDDRGRQSVENGLREVAEELLVGRFVVAGVPAAILAVAAHLNDENNLG